MQCKQQTTSCCAGSRHPIHLSCSPHNRCHMVQLSACRQVLLRCGQLLQLVPAAATPSLCPQSRRCSQLRRCSLRQGGVAAGREASKQSLRELKDSTCKQGSSPASAALQPEQFDQSSCTDRTKQPHLEQARPGHSILLHELLPHSRPRPCWSHCCCSWPCCNRWPRHCTICQQRRCSQRRCRGQAAPLLQRRCCRRCPRLLKAAACTAACA